MRRMIAIPCAGETLAATLDEAPGTTGLLIVSGGNEIRCGAHRGMALLAQRLSARGIPVLRYDRRGIGDSSGTNAGFLSSRPDLVAAASSFRAAVPTVSRLVGFGNCDAASALALFGQDAGLDGIVLANPWLAAETDDLPPAAAIRARYAQRLRDPREWLRLARGSVDIGNVIRGLRKLSATPAEVGDPHATRILDAIGRWGTSATVILAGADATARAYAAANGAAVRTVTIDTASHSFAGAAATRLEAEIVAAL